MPTTKPQMLSWYRAMQLIRQCEEQLARSHQRGLVHGACHTYVGQEAIAVGVCAHLRADDVVFSTHRGHGHALAKGVPPVELIAELFGRDSGCSRGRGGSMHLFAPEVGLMGTRNRGARHPAGGRGEATAPSCSRQTRLPWPSSAMVP
jgi:2-oxoisovalerate dehydrogenase E1 component